jgi:hypothetical protein
MKLRIHFFIIIGFLILLLGIAWYSLPGRKHEPAQIFPATISRDCAPWDGAAFTVKIPLDPGGSLVISIWQAPDIKFPKSFSFPDETRQVGNAILMPPAGLPEQLTGTVFFTHVNDREPVEGEYQFLTGTGRQFRGQFQAEWDDQMALCG